MTYKTYFTSDTHFWHQNVIKYCKRPWATVEEMNRGLIENWNAIVTPNDIVYHLGDFTFGPKPRTPEMRQKLNGKIILVRGNHDRKIEYLRESGFEVWSKVDTLIEGQRVTMAHYPPKWERWNEPPAVRFPWLHGHVHELWRRVGDIINVGVDQWGYKPVTLSELLACPQDTNPVTGHVRCKRDHWHDSVECTECHGFYDPKQQHEEAPEAM
jgi:calcineurin-like phosphoesterase family protein